MVVMLTWFKVTLITYPAVVDVIIHAWSGCTCRCPTEKLLVAGTLKAVNLATLVAVVQDPLTVSCLQES